MATSTDYLIKLLADTSNADKNLSGFRSRLGDFVTNTASVVAGIGLDRLGQAVGDFIGGSIEQASDLNETLSASSVIFGAQAAEIEAWGSTAAKNFGLSQRAAVDAATGFGDMFLQLGFTGDEAANSSQDIVQMAADLGSFKNLETSEVLDMISASMRGEYDSLQRVIPNINAARVQTEALAMTGKTAAAELTAQEKAQATLAIIQKDGARAAGDFARTQDSAANQSKIAAAALEDQQAVLGQQLLPMWQQLQSFLITNVIPGISSVVEWVTQNKDVVIALAAGIAVGTTAYYAINAAMALHRAYTLASAAATGGLTVAQWAFNAAASANPIGLIIIAIVALITAIVLLVMNWDTVVAWITQVWNGFINWVWSITEGFAAWWGDVWSGISAFFIDVWNGIVTVVTTLWQWHVDWIMGVISGFIGFWQGAWSTVSRVVTGVWNGIVNAVRNAIRWVMDGIGNGLNWISSAWNNMWGGLAGVVRGVFNGVIGAIQSGINGAIGLINGMIGAVNNVSGAVGITIPLIPSVSLPRLAQGGVTSGPTLALIGDNPGGREVVEPLSSYEARLDRAFEAGARSSQPAQQNMTLELHGDAAALEGMFQMFLRKADGSKVRISKMGKQVTA